MLRVSFAAIVSSTMLNTTAVIADTNCSLAVLPKDSGETQAHGVILYTYPRSHTINNTYNGCQSQWFLDDDHYRKLNVVHYKSGMAIKYDNLRIHGGIAYQCRYENKLLNQDDDNRCPAYEQLSKQTYQSGCYSKSKLNWSDSYDVAFDYCQLQ